MTDDPLATLDVALSRCRRCPRLVAWREEVARVKRRAYRDQEYWGRPAPGFGDPQARILVVGLAPGAHGANRTGRVFTGDGSGEFLFRALHRAGYANRPSSVHIDDGLALKDIWIAAVCRCVPPANKPLQSEIDACLPFMEREIALLPDLQGVVALGKIAFDNFLRLYNGQVGGKARRSSSGQPAPKFAHGAFYHLDGSRPLWLLATYHPSLQNTQTGRLTEAMFDAIWAQTRALLEENIQGQR